jgi:hypothetical protein
MPEIDVSPPPLATSLVPFADEAAEVQYRRGALVVAQVCPELVETQIGAPLRLPPPTATSLVPSAEEATALNCQPLPSGSSTWSLSAGTLRSVQSCARGWSITMSCSVLATKSPMKYFQFTTYNLFRKANRQPKIPMM